MSRILKVDSNDPNKINLLLKVAREMGIRISEADIEENENTVWLKLAEQQLEEEWNDKANDHWDDFFKNSPAAWCTYSQGDIVAVEFPFTDGSSSKKRPAIVISNSSIAPTGDVIILMVTSKTSDTAPMVNLTPDLLTRALPKNSFAKCHRIYTIDGELIAAKYSQLTEKGMALVRKEILSMIK